MVVYGRIKADDDGIIMMGSVDGGGFGMVFGLDMQQQPIYNIKTITGLEFINIDIQL